MPLSAPRVSPSVLAAIFVALIPLSARGAEMVHVVGKGQTLGAIARRYHVPVTALREANGLKSWQQIHPGLSLTIPEKGKEGEVAKKGEKGEKPRKGEEPAPAKPGKIDPKSKAAAKADPRGKAAAGGKGAKPRKDEADEKPEPLAHPPRKPGFVRLVRGTEKLEAQLLTRRGRLVPAALPGLSRVLRYYPTNEKLPIDPRLATLIGLVSDHFGGRTIHVTSGYRPYSPVQYTPHSNHNLGRAMDFSVEGVPNTVLRDFCRTFRNAGVGYYPNGTFIHLDVRSAKATWVDYSRAGEAPRYEGAGGAASADGAGGEVEPHEGADGTAGSPEAGPGSTDTQVAPVEVPGSKDGN